MAQEKGIYRHPSDDERKQGAIAVRKSDGLGFDGSRFFMLQADLDKPLAAGESRTVVAVMTPEDEAELEEWLSRVPGVSRG